MKKGAIFDLDGTMVDTMHIHDKAWERIFLKYGITLDAKEKAKHSGKKNVAFITHILTKRNVDTLNPEQLAKEKDNIVLDMLSREAPSVFPGLPELLEVLKKNQVKLALATSAAQETALLLAKDILSYFDIKIFAEDVTKGKPHPETFLLAAQRMDLKVSDCVVFEDSENGVEAAKSGGFLCIAKDNSAGQDLSKADLVIKGYEVENLKKVLLEQ
jgi:beta-phosphoglucomutase